MDSHTAGMQLQANSDLSVENSGTDAYGFSALPGGNYGGLSFASWDTMATGGQVQRPKHSSRMVGA